MIHTDAGYYTPVPPPSGSGSPTYMHVWYLKDHLGNNRVLADGTGTALRNHHYDPFGESITLTGDAASPFPTGATESPYKYGGKEWDSTTSTYNFEARQFSPNFHRFTTMDPLCEKYYGISPYAYCANNPVNMVDPEGLSTWVMQNDDGTYRVVGGDLGDQDRSVYVVDENNVPQYTLGYSLTMYSFCNMDGGREEWMIGAKIDLNDSSGINFTNKMTTKTPPLLYYMANALNGEKYDFKVTNGSDKEYSEVLEYYRGMPIFEDEEKRTIIASARDIGNYVAGYQAGARAISWVESRIAFDALETLSHHKLKHEAFGSQAAQFCGWSDGRSSVQGISASILRLLLRRL